VIAERIPVVAVILQKSAFLPQLQQSKNRTNQYYYNKKFHILGNSN